jgi:hypothetical protein
MEEGIAPNFDQMSHEMQQRLENELQRIESEQ